MRKRFATSAVLSLALLCVTATAQAQAPVPSPDKAAKIDEVVRAAHGLRQFNGAVLVAENGQVVFRKGYGMANMEWNIPVEADTKFRLGSITKQFTSALILQLVEQGKIKLDGKLSDYLPEYRKDTGGRITIHQLLNHTSGVPSYTGRPTFFAEESRDPYTVSDFVKKFASGDLEFEPGSKFNYNNSGYSLLGAIIEQVAGKPYEQVLKERILDPLGMKNTGYDHHGTLLAKRASGYSKTPAGYDNAPYLDMSIPYAAGSMYSTIEDLYLWDQALYTDKVLSAKSRELMYTPGLRNYAYGWGIQKVPLGGKETTIVQHSGGINGFATLIVRIPESRHLVVLLDNTQGTKLQQVAQNIARVLYGMPTQPLRLDIAEELMSTIMSKDVVAAVKQYRELKATRPAEFDFSEPQLNNVGYQLLQMKRVKDAIEILKLNVEMYPQGFNTYDSLGEAYMVDGQKELAIQNYRKSLELNPQNTGAVEALKKLEGK
jgi:CubicO group peptidase (beta-lactamase class C family)